MKTIDKKHNQPIAEALQKIKWELEYVYKQFSWGKGDKRGWGNLVPLNKYEQERQHFEAKQRCQTINKKLETLIDENGGYHEEDHAE
tara:strand:- start:1080 stop:1340 length:261 start_codon:yes stop_codon:yes gene_type:complete